MLNISSSYLSQIEHGKRICPDKDLLNRIIEVFDLNEKDKIRFFESYENASGKLSPDIVEYVKENEIVKKALRMAKAYDATDSDWEMFIASIKK